MIERLLVECNDTKCVHRFASAVPQNPEYFGKPGRGIARGKIEICPRCGRYDSPYVYEWRQGRA